MGYRAHGSLFWSPLDALGEHLDSSPKSPRISLGPHPNPRARNMAPGLPQLAWVHQATGGEPQSDWGPRNFSKWGENPRLLSPTRGRGPRSGRGARRPPTPGVSRPLCPRGNSFPPTWDGSRRSPAAPTSLRLQLPVVGDPVAGVRFHQEGARHGPPANAGPPARPPGARGQRCRQVAGGLVH